MTPISGKVQSVASGSAAVFPPHLYFVAAAVFHYLGPSFAVLLFARVSVAGVAWLRVVSAGLLFALWRRPWRSFFATTAEARRRVLVLGTVIAVMNYAFYMAIARLPLATVGAIEFLGPVALALFGVRSARNVMALALAVMGVYMLTDIHFVISPGAMLWAYLDAALFAAYIMAAHAVSRIAEEQTPVDGLAAAMLVACAVITPLGLGGALPAMRDPVALCAGVGVGVSSSVIPYVFDQLAMRRLPRATYALFVAILPAMAVLIGALVLHQIPTAPEALAIALIIAAVLLQKDTAPKGRTAPMEDQRCSTPSVCHSRSDSP